MKRLAILAAIAASLTFGTTSARAEYPEKPITLVIPYGPGGGTDLSARILATALSEILGQPVVPVNKEGGGGAVALGQLFAEKPDGYTIAVGTGSNMTIIPHTTDVGYKVEDFTYIANYFGWPYMIVVHPDVPATNLKELVDWAKANPDALVSATTGGFNIHEIAMALMSQKAGGIVYRSLPTNSAAESTARVLAGDANVVVGSPATYMEHYRAGALRILGIVSDVVGPALEPLNLEKSKDTLGFELTNTTVLIGPPGMEEAIRAKLEAAVKEALARPDVIEQIEKLGFPMMYEPGPDAKAKTIATYETYGEAIKSLSN